jgi:uncharacterized protein (TIGR02145 family)
MKSSLSSVIRPESLVKPLVFTVIFFFLLFSYNSFAQGVGINTDGSAADNSSIIDVKSVNKGLLIPRMTTSERDGIPSPALSLLIFNITTNCFEAYVNRVWYSVSCPPPCSSPSSPVAGSSVPSSGSILWNWGSVSGANAYKWSTANNYLSAIDNGSVTSYTQSALHCNTGYSLYVWAYNNCGNSSYTTLTQTTSSCICTIAACGSQVFMCTNMELGISSYIPQTTQQTNGQEWCYNNVYANCTQYGGLFEWADAVGLPNTYNSNIYNLTETWETCNPCGSNGKQGICPAGYHIPTDLEWSQYEYCINTLQAPADNNSATNTLNYFQTTGGWRGSNLAGIGPGDKMKAKSNNSPSWDGTNSSGFAALPAGASQGGSSVNIGKFTDIWSATEMSLSNAMARTMGSGFSQSFRGFANKADGLTVRCIQN